MLGAAGLQSNHSGDRTEDKSAGIMQRQRLPSPNRSAVSLR
jgi:hypothetical protein